MKEIILNSENLGAICDVVADTSRGLTKTQLVHILNQSGMNIEDDGGNKGMIYTLGLKKSKWLFNCFVGEINKNRSNRKIFDFIEKVLNPVNFRDVSKREQYSFLFEELNKVLLFNGLTITKEGKLREEVQAKTLDEVDNRVNSLKRELYNRKIHKEVERYCIKDYLRKDYHAAVFEASKGLAERVRIITGLKLDGGRLFDTAFSTNDPCIFFNSLKTVNEKNEFIGLKELLCAIFHLVRNPEAHTPKINWIIEEHKALDVLTIISFTHKYLDECHKIPGK